MDLKINLDDQDIQRIAGEVTQRLLPHLKAKESTDEVMTVKTLAEFLKVSPKWIYDRVQCRKIPFTKTGGFLRFRKSEINEFLNSHKVPVCNPLTTKLKGEK